MSIKKLAIGDKVGRWTIAAEPARGGNARVYRVISDDGSTGALKQLYKDTSESLGRFRREFQAVQSLDPHPNVLRVLDAPTGPDDDDLWYVMEWVDGGTLQDRRSDFEGQLAASIDVAIGITSGVQALHAKAIIHRDIKPDNILFRSSGEPAVSDLGLCWIRDFSTERLTPDERATGAWGFRAPEHEHQRVEHVGETSDLFSAVKVLWWMIHGGSPFASAHWEGPQFDLAQKYSDIRMHSISVLMAKVIVADPAKRSLRSAIALLEELTRIQQQLKSTSRGRIAGAIRSSIARQKAHLDAHEAFEDHQRLLEDDFPNLRRRWKEALDQVLTEAAEVAKQEGHQLALSRIDHLQDQSRGQPDALGFRIGQIDAVLIFSYATAHNTGRRTLMSATMKCHIDHRHDASARFEFCGILDRELVGTRCAGLLRLCSLRRVGLSGPPS